MENQNLQSKGNKFPRPNLLRMKNSLERKVSAASAQFNAENSPTNKLLVPKSVSSETFSKGFSLHNVLCGASDAGRCRAVAFDNQKESLIYSKIPVYRKTIERKPLEEFEDDVFESPSKKTQDYNVAYNDPMKTPTKASCIFSSTKHLDKNSNESFQSAGGYVSALDESFESDKQEKCYQLEHNKAQKSAQFGQINNTILNSCANDFYYSPRREIWDLLLQQPDSTANENHIDSVLVADMRKKCHSLKMGLDSACYQVDSVVDNFCNLNDSTLGIKTNFHASAIQVGNKFNVQNNHEQEKKLSKKHFSDSRLMYVNKSQQTTSRMFKQKSPVKDVSLKPEDLRLDFSNLSSTPRRATISKKHGEGLIPHATHTSSAKYETNLTHSSLSVNQNIGVEHSTSQHDSMRKQFKDVIRRQKQAWRDFARAQFYLLQELHKHSTIFTNTQGSFVLEYKQILKEYDRKKCEVESSLSQDTPDESLLSQRISEISQIQSETKSIHEKIKKLTEERNLKQKTRSSNSSKLIHVSDEREPTLSFSIPILNQTESPKAPIEETVVSTVEPLNNQDCEGWNDVEEKDRTLELFEQIESEIINNISQMDIDNITSRTSKSTANTADQSTGADVESISDEIVTVASEIDDLALTTDISLSNHSCLGEKLHEMEPFGNIECQEKSDDVENSEQSEDAENSEQSENVENREQSEDAENSEQSENVENREQSEDVENREQFEDLENREQFVDVDNHEKINRKGVISSCEVSEVADMTTTEADISEDLAISFKPSEESLKSILSMQSNSQNSSGTITRRDSANDAILKLALTKCSLSGRRESLTGAEETNKSPRALVSPVERFTTKFVTKRDSSRRSSLCFDQSGAADFLDDISNCVSILDLSRSPTASILPRQSILALIRDRDLSFIPHVEQPQNSNMSWNALVRQHAKRILLHFAENKTIPEVPMDEEENEGLIEGEQSFVVNWCYELAESLYSSLPSIKAKQILSSEDEFLVYLEDAMNNNSEDGALEPNLQRLQKQMKRRCHLQLDTNRVLALSTFYSQPFHWMFNEVTKMDRNISKLFLGSEV